MRRNLFLWFLALDLLLSQVMIGAFPNDLLIPELVGSLVIRTPSVGLVLFLVGRLVRWRSGGAGRLAPFLWFALGVAAGYFVLFAITSLLGSRTLWDRSMFAVAHEDWRVFVTIQGPYIAAFLITSALYWAGWGRLTRRPEAAALAR